MALRIVVVITVLIAEFWWLRRRSRKGPETYLKYRLVACVCHDVFLPPSLQHPRLPQP